MEDTSDSTSSTNRKERNESLYWMDPFLYLIGHGGAIRRVAGSRVALWLGFFLVFTAGIARNYNRVSPSENLFPYVSPLILSLFTSFFLFLFWYVLVLRRLLWVDTGNNEEERSSEADPPDSEEQADERRSVYPRNPLRFLEQYRVFLQLFWMTAPIAWLYAVPVEQMMSDVAAARWNVGFLASVIVWRGLVFFRALSVAYDVPFLESFAVVSVPSSMVAFVGSIIFNIRIVGFMSGSDLSRAKEILRGAASAGILGSVVLFLLAFAGSIYFQRRARLPGRVPSVSSSEDHRG